MYMYVNKISTVLNSVALLNKLINYVLVIKKYIIIGLLYKYITIILITDGIGIIY